MPFNLNLRHNVFTRQSLHITQIANWSFDKKNTQTNKLILFIYKTYIVYLQNAGNACKLQTNLEIVHYDLDFLKIVISTYRNNTLSSSP